MQVLITGKKMEVGVSLSTQAERKLLEISKKYGLNPLEATVVFSKNGSSFHCTTRCDLEMHLGKGVYVRAHSEEDDSYASLEKALEVFEKRLRKYKGKLLDYHHKKDAPYVKSLASQYTIDIEKEDIVQEDNPLIIAEVETEIPTLTVSEAVMRLDLSQAHCMLFRNAKSDQLNAIYRRPDRNLGWIAPSENATQEGEQK